MFALQIYFLTGRYAASQFNNRERAEWPPHPARLFSALVQSWVHQGQRPDLAEALDALAALPAPEIVASESSKSDEQPTYYVPINDSNVTGNWIQRVAEVEDLQAEIEANDSLWPAKTKKSKLKLLKKLEKALEKAWKKAFEDTEKLSAKAMVAAQQMLPGQRGKQARHFPSVCPAKPIVRFQWPSAELSTQVFEGLDQLSKGVTRLGHSRSLVACSVDREHQSPTFIPGPKGSLMLRHVYPNQRRLLERAFQMHRGVQTRSLPYKPTKYESAGSKRTEPERPSSFSGEWIVLGRVGGFRPRLDYIADWTNALRKALMSFAPEPVHPLISGHSSDGPLESCHTAFLGLPFVGRKHADGAVMGFAICPPKDAPESLKTALYKALARWRSDSEARADGRPGCMNLALSAGGRSRCVYLKVYDSSEWRQTLDSRTWTQASRYWVSVTPVALDSNPGDLYSKTPEKATRAEIKALETLRRSCEMVGLPTPTSLSLQQAPVTTGSVPARFFGPYPRRQKQRHFRKVLVHVRLQFAEAIEGPILLGAGRFRGLGLFRPFLKEAAL